MELDAAEWAQRGVDEAAELLAATSPAKAAERVKKARAALEAFDTANTQKAK